MTAILDDIRRLDAAHARGDISAVELAAAKAQLMDSIPDVTPDAEAEAEATRDEPPAPRHGVVPILMFCGVMLVVCAGTALLLTGDLLLSATLAITVLAAFTIMLFRQIE
ncbi:MAG: hypothetical protein AAFQ59_19225 [Pseudomonadota bacterium]